MTDLVKDLYLSFSPSLSLSLSLSLRPWFIKKFTKNAKSPISKTTQCFSRVLALPYKALNHVNCSLLLLAAPIWLWDRCGGHNSPTASSVMDLVFRRYDGSHISVDTVHPSLLRSSSLSSPAWYHLLSLSSYVIYWYLYVANHLSRTFLHLSAILSTFSLSLMFSFLTWSLKGALYRIQILCRRYTFWSYPAGLTIAEPPG